MFDDYFDQFKVSTALLVVAGVLFLAGAGAGAVLLTREGEFSCPGGGDGEAALQKSLDSVLGQYEKWERSRDGSWRRKAKVSRRDVYRVETHGGTAYIVLRGAEDTTENDESKWLVVQDWCTSSDFLDAVPKVSRGGPATTVP